MAKLVLTDSKVTFNGTDISTNVAAVTLNVTANEVTTTAFGQGAVTRVGGIQDNSVTLSIHNDYSAIEGLVYPQIGSTAQIIVKPNGTTVGTANPQFSMQALIVEWSPVNGAVGELNAVDVTWPISGTVTKTTS